MADIIQPLGTRPSYIRSVGLIDKCIGSKLWIIMKDKREFVGVLCGFDDYVNMVLENATMFKRNEDSSEFHREDVGKVLLNGAGVCFLVPGGNGPQQQ